MDELNSFGSIPGTNIERYLNRVINSIEKRIYAPSQKAYSISIVIRKAVDAFAEPDLTEEEMRIDQEIEKLMFDI
jgi:hypothetical protein